MLNDAKFRLTEWSKVIQKFEIKKNIGNHILTRNPMSPNLVPGPVSTPEFSIFSLELCPGSLFFHANSRPQYGVADFRISGPGPGLESQLPFLFF